MEAVPVGILLSGGVDSSLVTAMAVRASSKVQTFSIGFPGHGKADETEHARLIARHFGTRHTELMAEDASADLLPRLARQFDEPIIDSSMVPTFLVSQLVRQNCTVALAGDMWLSAKSSPAWTWLTASNNCLPARAVLFQATSPKPKSLSNLQLW